MTKITIVMEDKGGQVIVEANGNLTRESFMEFLFLGLQDMLPIFSREALKKYKELQETQVEPTKH